MTAPSNANTSGLTQDLCERLDAILVEESPMHPFGCATWDEASRVAIDMAKEVIVTAASAQARIAEEQAEIHTLTVALESSMTMGETAEARADRLAKALERQADNMAFVLNHANIGTWFDKFTTELAEDRAALQQEG